MNHLQTVLAEKQDQLMPKKKFTFTKRKKEKETSSDGVISEEDKSAGQLATVILTSPLQHGIFSKKNEICVMKVRINIVLLCKVVYGLCSLL